MIVPDELLRRLDVPGPRYTSYPTADRFVEAFGPAQYEAALRQRAQGLPARSSAAPLSLYVHVPFCESVCYYCGCNKIVTKHHERGREYLQALHAEIEMHVELLGRGQPVSQLHFGGGSPTFLSDDELELLMGWLREAFRIVPGAETSIEVDPRTATPERLKRLAQLGFNRISFGVQDFDADVQQAVHRIQSYESVRDLIVAARAHDFESVNVDLIYGLPKQTPESFARTISSVCELRPDRIALYAYAHLPSRFKPQRRIHSADLPLPEQRIKMLGGAIGSFIGHGYAYIGMDHFALPGDSLAAAKRQGRLHRNFQGYTTQPDCDMIGFGVSSIGHVGATYSQNAKTLAEYYDAIGQRQFPIIKGLTLTRDDVIRKAVIMAVMCQGHVDFDAFEQAHLIKFREYFAPDLERLKPLVEGGLVEVGSGSIDVTPMGWFFVRAVAMCFDRYVQAEGTRDRFSKIV